MKKVLFICFALLPLACFAQNTDSINQVKDYIAAKLVAQYLEKLDKNEDKDNYEKIRDRLNNNTIVKPITNKELSDLLDKNGFKTTNKTFLPKVAELKFDNKNTIVSQLYNITSNVTKDTSLKSKLQDEANQYLIHPAENKGQKAATASHDNDQGSNSGREDDKTKNQTEDRFTTFNPNLWNILIDFFIILICILFNNSIRNRKRRVPQSENHNFSQSDRDLSNIDRQIYTLNQRLTNLSNTVENINKVSHKPTVNYTKNDEGQTLNEPRNASNTDISNQNIPSRNIESQVFFMLEPIDDIFSNLTKSNDYRKGFSMYKFFQKNNLNEASFEFISDDENIKIVRNNYLKSIRPACTMINDANQNTSLVKTIEKGIARLEGDNWKIVKKATIKFE